jgi:cell division protein FtsX
LIVGIHIHYSGFVLGAVLEVTLLPVFLASFETSRSPAHFVLLVAVLFLLLGAITAALIYYRTQRAVWYDKKIH